MFRSKLFWGLVLGVVTSVLIFEGKMNLGDGAFWSRAVEGLTAAGTHFANGIFPSGIPEGGWWRKVYDGLSTGCNFLVYAVFWFGLIWIIGYFRERQHPYDRQHTLVPPSLR